MGTSSPLDCQTANLSLLSQADWKHESSHFERMKHPGDHLLTTRSDYMYTCSPVGLRMHTWVFAGKTFFMFHLIEPKMNHCESQQTNDRNITGNYNVRNVVLQITSVLFHDSLSLTPPYWVCLD